jgi:hypothetical protein
MKRVPGSPEHADGYRFRNFSQEQGLPHRSNHDLLEARSGTDLVATSAGLSILNPFGRPYRWNVRESRLEQTAAEPPLFRRFLPPPIPTRQRR